MPQPASSPPSPARFARQLLVLLPLLAASIPGLIPAHAGEDPATAGSTAVLNERIDLRLKEAAAAEIMKMFGQILEAQVRLDPQVDGAVTITLNNVTVRTALTATCESLGCRWRFLPAEPARLIVDPQPQPRVAEPGTETTLTLELDHVTARDAFEAIARIGGFHVILGPAVEGELSVSLTDRRVGEVLDHLCLQLGCRWEMTVGSEGTLLRVERRESGEG